MIYCEIPVTTSLAKVKTRVENFETFLVNLREELLQGYPVIGVNRQTDIGMVEVRVFFNDMKIFVGNGTRVIIYLTVNPYQSDISDEESLDILKKDNDFMLFIENKVHEFIEEFNDSDSEDWMFPLNLKGIYLNGKFYSEVSPTNTPEIKWSQFTLQNAFTIELKC